MTCASLIFSIIGCLLSGISIFFAKSAKEAANNAKDKINNLNNAIEFRKQLEQFNKVHNRFIRKTCNDDWHKGLKEKTINCIISDYIDALNDLCQFCVEDNNLDKSPSLKNLIIEVSEAVRIFDKIGTKKKQQIRRSMFEIKIRLEEIVKECKDKV